MKSVPVFVLFVGNLLVATSSQAAESHGYIDWVDSDHPVVGFSDGSSVDTCTISGWARDADFAGAVSVHVYQGGEAGSGGTYLGSTVADIPRGDGWLGYEFIFPPNFASTFYAYGIGVDRNGIPDGQNTLFPIFPPYTPGVADRQLICSSGIDPSEESRNVNFQDSLGFIVGLGAVERVLYYGDAGIRAGTPDTAMSAEIVDGVTKTFFTCSDGNTAYSCLSETSSLSTFNNADGIYKAHTHNSFQTVLEPAIPGDPYESNYAGIASTWRDPFSGHIHAWYHSEISVPGCAIGFYASVGYAISTDGGYSFTKQGRAITSAYPVTPWYCHGQGASEPKVVEFGDYLYMTYDQDRDVNYGPGGITLARALKSNPALWYKYHNGGFTEPGIDGRMSPVIRIGQNGMQSWAAFVIWNSYLSEFVMLHTDYFTEGSVYIRTSADLISWSDPGLLFTDAPNHSYRYVTMLGDTDDSMGQSGWLYFGRLDKWNFARAFMARRAISFEGNTR